jgi:hypothetical protein
MDFGHIALQFPNKRVMIMKANNKVGTNGEDEEDKMPPLEDANDVCVEYPVEEEALVVTRALNMHVKVDDLEGQRENIFHMRCHVHNKVYNLIIDGGSHTNVAGTKLVRKLNLHTTKHPYLINYNGEVKVNMHVLVAFFIGKYCDKVM